MCQMVFIIIEITLSMISNFQFSYSQAGYKAKYYHSLTQFSVAIGYGASV